MPSLALAWHSSYPVLVPQESQFTNTFPPAVVVTDLRCSNGAMPAYMYEQSKESERLLCLRLSSHVEHFLWTERITNKQIWNCVNRIK